MEYLLQGNAHRRVVRMCLHDVSHHVPPPLGHRVHLLRILRVALALTLLIGKQRIGVTIPVDAVP